MAKENKSEPLSAQDLKSIITSNDIYTILETIKDTYDRLEELEKKIDDLSEKIDKKKKKKKK